LPGTIGTSAKQRDDFERQSISYSGIMTLTATATAGETSLTAVTPAERLSSRREASPIANAASYSRAKGADIPD